MDFMNIFKDLITAINILEAQKINYNRIVPNLFAWTSDNKIKFIAFPFFLT